MLKIFRFEYCDGACLDWIVAYKQEEAVVIFKEFSGEDTYESVDVVGIDELPSYIEDFNVKYALKYAPCYLFRVVIEK